MSILIVDDDRALRQYLVDLLAAEGYATKTAENGRQAWALLRRKASQPCLILLDMEMPTIDGWELLKRLKLDATLARIQIVLISAHPDIRDIARRNFDGSIIFLPKPINPARLIELAQQFCQRRNPRPSPSERAAS